MLWQGALLPFGAALAVLAAASALRLQASGTAVSVTAGFLVSFFAMLHGQWSPMPKVALDWVPWIAVGSLAGSFAVERLPRPGARFAARLAVALAAAALVVWPAAGSLGAQKAGLAAVAIALVLAKLWSAAAPMAQGGSSRALLPAIVAGGAGIALLLDSSQSAGRLSGALASALFAAVVFNLPRLRLAFSPAAAGVTVMLLGTLLASAWVYADFPLGYVALIAAGLLAEPGLAAIDRLRGRGSRRSWLPAAVLTAMPVMAAVALAVKAMMDAGGY